MTPDERPGAYERLLHQYEIRCVNVLRRATTAALGAWALLTAVDATNVNLGS